MYLSVVTLTETVKKLTIEYQFVIDPALVVQSVTLCYTPQSNPIEKCESFRRLA